MKSGGLQVFKFSFGGVEPPEAHCEFALLNKRGNLCSTKEIFLWQNGQNYETIALPTEKLAAALATYPGMCTLTECYRIVTACIACGRSGLDSIMRSSVNLARSGMGRSAEGRCAEAC